MRQRLPPRVGGVRRREPGGRGRVLWHVHGGEGVDVRRGQQLVDRRVLGGVRRRLLAVVRVLRRPHLLVGVQPLVRVRRRQHGRWGRVLRHLQHRVRVRVLGGERVFAGHVPMHAQHGQRGVHAHVRGQRELPDRVLGEPREQQDQERLQHHHRGLCLARGDMEQAGHLRDRRGGRRAQLRAQVRRLHDLLGLDRALPAGRRKDVSPPGARLGEEQ
mmetsp:Transcript_31939/g.80420  ORF Transcript_31939/g.80420 Transcript_31939/m.80420 type:complete len:216 (-) Transcript_31939:1030-1677(-)